MQNTGEGTLLEVQLFGRPRLRCGGEEFAFRAPPRALSLLAYLLLHGDKPLAREALAAAFWPDVTDAHARTKLRSHLHYLIADALPQQGIPWIVADKRTVRWNPAAPVRVDVLEFERLAAQADGTQQAAELYTGDLLEGFDDEWIEPVRERLRERQAAVLWNAIEQNRRSGSHARAILCAQRLLELDPWREDAVRAVVQLRAQSGDRAGALQAYRDFAARMHRDLGVEPMPETIAVYDAVMSGAQASNPGAERRIAGSHNLPSYITSFVNRADELAALHSLVKERRLVTLTGAGGFGKTRLAIETARSLVGAFANGVWLVDLAPLTENALIVRTVASALGLQARTDEDLLCQMRDFHALLVFDNCEHLEGVAQTVETILRRCPTVHVLATGREALHVTGERRHRVPSLPIPAAELRDALPSIEELRRTPSVQLFLDRAADVAPSFEPHGASQEDLRALVAIAQQLDGIPLAIELAAARMGALNLPALARRLDERLALLAAAHGAAMPRHQTLRATIDWSYDALAPIDQRIFARMGVFADGWVLAAACGVCSDFETDRWQIQDRLSSLVDKSLIVADRGGGEIRYRMLETLRAYALERLKRIGETEPAGRMHAQYYASYSSVHVSRRIQGGGWFAELKTESANLRAAMKWCIDEGNDPVLGATIAEAFAWFAYDPMLFEEAARRCETALEAFGAQPPPEYEAVLQLGRSRCYTYLTHAQPALAAAERAAELLRVLDDRSRLTYALGYLAEALWQLGRPEESAQAAEEACALARDHPHALGAALTGKARTTSNLEKRREILQQALQAYRAAGSRSGVCHLLLHLGECAFEGGDAAGALEYARQCIELTADDIEWQRHLVALMRGNAAAYALALGEIETARSFARASVELAKRMNDRRRIAFGLQHLAGVSLERGDVRRAAQLLGASDAHLADRSAPRRYTERLGYEKAMEKLRAVLGETQLQALLVEGRRWSTERAVEAAMEV